MDRNTLLKELENLTSRMDIPEFRRTKVEWLAKNIKVRNSEHPKLNKVLDIIQQLRKMGVQ